MTTQKTNIGLVEYCEAQLGRPYWFGTFGQLATMQLYDNRKKAYPRYYTDLDYCNQFGVKVHDCVGLIKGYFWCDGPNDGNYNYRSNGLMDITSDTLFEVSTRKGFGLANMPRVPGIAVFMVGHVGVLVDSCHVIEARGHDYGVIKTKLCERPWTKWAYIPNLVYK